MLRVLSRGGADGESFFSSIPDERSKREKEKVRGSWSIRISQASIQSELRHFREYSLLDGALACLLSHQQELPTELNLSSCGKARQRKERQRGKKFGESKRSSTLTK